MRIRWIGSTLVAAAALFCGQVATAGVNAGGTLVVHVPPTAQSSLCTEDVNYVCAHPTECLPLASCAEADARHDGPSYILFGVFAAFATEATPRLAGLSFGIEYPADGVLLIYGEGCADFELTTGSWPESGEGTALTWNTPRTDSLTPVYWFLGYNYYSPQPTSFRVTPHPTQGGYFADDSVPSVLDEVAGFGELGFDQPGVVICPTVQIVTGACCFGCTCVVVESAICAEQNGVYAGDDVPCEPLPCPPGEAAGACCLPDGSCVVERLCDCLDLGGTFYGSNFPCEATPCAPVATRGTTWGGIKAIFR
ncbi:MAG: hypothetical protein IPK72_14105 [Candidatus Eisenbacteria bacterium]|nr:hypothetical protein [Candidatus Eisenbacteria bacterium]